MGKYGTKENQVMLTSVNPDENENYSNIDPPLCKMNNDSMGLRSRIHARFVHSRQMDVSRVLPYS